MTYMAVKFNFQQVLQKTLIPTMNTFKDTAVLNIVKTDGNDFTYLKEINCFSSEELPL